MLKKGDVIPQIVLKNHDGESIDLYSFKEVCPLVIYFYPKNNTPGCTAEACSFRDHYEEFRKVGAEVIGISSDSVSSHQKVRKKKSLPFILLSDPDRIAEKAFGVPRNLFGMLPGRVTFITDKTGVIIHTFNAAFNPLKHVTESLKYIRSAITHP